MRWISIVLELTLLVIGVLLGIVYQNYLYIYWLLVMALLILFSQGLINNLTAVKSDLEKYKDKVSALSTLKENANYTIQLSLFPETSRMVIEQEKRIELFITSTFPLDAKQDIKIITQKEWIITMSNQLQEGKLYGGKYEYILKNPAYDIVDDKFSKVIFFVKFLEPGEYDFLIEINNGSVRGGLSSSFTVYSK